MGLVILCNDCIFAGMSSFSELFKVVADSHPMIEYMGMKFRVKRLSAADSLQALSIAKANALDFMSKLPESSKTIPVDQAMRTEWIKRLFPKQDKEQSDALADQFGLTSTKTQHDLDAAIFAYLTYESYLKAFSLLDENGMSPSSNELDELAKLIRVDSGLSSLIDSTHSIFTEPEPEKNGQSPSETLSQSPN